MRDVESVLDHRLRLVLEGLNLVNGDAHGDGYLGDVQVVQFVDQFLAGLLDEGFEVSDGDRLELVDEPSRLWHVLLDGRDIVRGHLDLLGYLKDGGAIPEQFLDLLPAVLGDPLGVVVR